MSTLPPPPFSGVTTFARQQYRPDPSNAEVAILGVPYDSSTSNRSGTRFGPRAIREQSSLLWGYNNVQQVAPFEVLRVVDAGDVDVIPVSIEATHAVIQSRVEALLATGTQILALGGDHSITLPLLRAHVKKHGQLAVVHFDAHPDTWAYEYPGHPYSHGTPFARAFEESLIDPQAYIQIGIRGPTGGPQDYEEALALGTRMLTFEECQTRSTHEILSEIHERIQQRPVYLTFDIDCVDPAFAPGTGTPEVGGLTSYQALQLVRGLKGLQLVGFDLVEVSPPYDHASITSILGANLAFEFLSLLAVQKTSVAA